MIYFSKQMIIVLLFIYCATGYSQTKAALKDVPQINIETHLSKATAYPQEQILITYTFLTRVDARYEGYETQPRFPSSWYETFDEKNIKTQLISRNGINMITADIDKKALFPMKAGTWLIEPGVAKVVPKWSGNKIVEEQHRKNIILKPLQVEILEFPKLNKPDDFNDFTGDFSLRTQGRLIQEPFGDYFEINLTVVGRGNIRQFPMPVLELPEGLKAQKPIESVKVEWDSLQNIQGEKNFKIRLMPDAQRLFVISPAHFSYFNSTSGKYVSVKGSELAFRAEKIPKVEKVDEKSITGNTLSILLDVSESMLARDFVTEDRLTVAKQIVQRLMKSEDLKQSAVSLHVFEGEVSEVLDLTNNKDQVIDASEKIESRKLLKGTAVGDALLRALFALQSSGQKNNKSVLLITDGAKNAGHIDVLTAANMLKEKDIPVYVVVLGSDNEVEYPIEDKDFGDHFIKTIGDIDLPAMKDLSKYTNGRFYAVQKKEQIEQVISDLAKVVASKE